MKAGRELDLLVAKRVMGITHNSDGEPKGIPAYSTDIAAAWEVVEFMMVKNREYLSIIGTVNCGFEVELGGRSESKTLPHAICLAALRGVSQDL